jgi:hypothetical protein
VHGFDSMGFGEKGIILWGNTSCCDKKTSLKELRHWDPTVIIHKTN